VLVRHSYQSVSRTQDRESDKLGWSLHCYLTSLCSVPQRVGWETLHSLSTKPFMEKWVLVICFPARDLGSNRQTVSYVGLNPDWSCCHGYSVCVRMCMCVCVCMCDCVCCRNVKWAFLLCRSNSFLICSAVSLEASGLLLWGFYPERGLASSQTISMFMWWPWWNAALIARHP